MSCKVLAERVELNLIQQISIAESLLKLFEQVLARGIDPKDVRGVLLPAYTDGSNLVWHVLPVEVPIPGKPITSPEKLQRLQGYSAEDITSLCCYACGAYTYTTRSLAEWEEHFSQILFASLIKSDKTSLAEQIGICLGFKVEFIGLAV